MKKEKSGSDKENRKRTILKMDNLKTPILKKTNLKLMILGSKNRKKDNSELDIYFKISIVKKIFEKGHLWKGNFKKKMTIMNRNILRNNNGKKTLCKRTIQEMTNNKKSYN